MLLSPSEPPSPEITKITKEISVRCTTMSHLLCCAGHTICSISSYITCQTWISAAPHTGREGRGARAKKVTGDRAVDNIE